jgi:hypothetical protein
MKMFIRATPEDYAEPLQPVTSSQHEIHFSNNLLFTPRFAAFLSFLYEYTNSLGTGRFHKFISSLPDLIYSRQRFNAPPPPKKNSG